MSRLVYLQRRGWRLRLATSTADPCASPLRPRILARMICLIAGCRWHEVRVTQQDRVLVSRMCSRCWESCVFPVLSAPMDVCGDREHKRFDAAERAAHAKRHEEGGTA